LTVTSAADDGSSGTLRSVIASAGPGDTITFAKALSGDTITLTQGELNITQSLDIEGPGADKLSVSGDNSSRVFEVAAGLSVTISGLTVTNGYAVFEGGGILNDGSNLTLSADTLAQNVVYESATDASPGATDLYANGGALYSVAGSVNITGCQITGNQALGAAGLGAFGEAYGGGVNVQAGTGAFSDSTISDNVARGGDDSSNGAAQGGGIFATAPVTITGCGINDNLARGGDNAIYANGGAAGGLGFFGVSAIISDATFAGNQAIGGSGGAGGGAGGAIGNFLGSVSITGSTFNDNEVSGGNGGLNSANNFQGTVDPYVDMAWGGAIYAVLATTTASNCSFSHNQANGGNNSTSIGTDDVEAGDALGGAIFSGVGCTTSFFGCTFDHNQANGGNGNTAGGPVALVDAAIGGAINSSYGGGTLGPTALTVSNCVLTQNDATGGNSNSGTASVAALVGAGVGAGIANYFGGAAAVSGSLLSKNQASGGYGNTASGAGALFIGLGAGGGIFNSLGNYNSSGYGPLNASVVTVSGCSIDHNQAVGGTGGDGYGGGLADLLSATSTLSGTEVSHNLAQGGSDGGNGYGGGLYNDATSTLMLQSCTVTHNDADGGDGGDGIGGGIYNLGSFTYDASTVIKHNHASTSGDEIGP
jgi:hypothetical protein